MLLHYLVFLPQLPLRCIVENNLVFVHLRSLMYACGTGLRLWQLCGRMIKQFVPKHDMSYKRNKGIAVLILALGTRTSPVGFTLRPCYFLDPLNGRLSLTQIKSARFEYETNLLSPLGLLCGHMRPYKKLGIAQVLCLTCFACKFLHFYTNIASARNLHG